MRTSIVFPQNLWEDALKAFSSTDLETAAYALVGVSKLDGRQQLLVREVMHLQETDYDERLHIHLLISPRFIRRVIQRCEETGLGVVAMHSHPMQHQHVDFSPSDNFGEQRELRVFNDFGEGKWPLASLVWGPGGVKARMWDFSRGKGKATPIQELRLVGQRWQRHELGDSNQGGGHHSETHDRQIRLFGKEGQNRLSGCRVAIVGAGGTGSAISEMLTRLGVGQLVLMDPDKLELSNVSRVYGSTPRDVGKLKVHVVASWLKQIAPEATVETHALDARENLLTLRDVDFVFACTDNDSSRAALNQFTQQYLKPMIELGNRIDSDGESIRAAAARLTYTYPGAPCLECFGSINHARVRDELLSKEERARLAKEGYVEGATVAEPSIVTLNTFIASLACTKFLAVVNGIGGLESQRYTYSYLSSELRAVGASFQEPCICSRYRGYGDLRPLPSLAPQERVE
jgi:molybdopterin-synthase adenylyltransferase